MKYNIHTNVHICTYTYTHQYTHVEDGADKVKKMIIIITAIIVW